MAILMLQRELLHLTFHMTKVPLVHSLHSPGSANSFDILCSCNICSAFCIYLQIKSIHDYNLLEHQTLPDWSFIVHLLVLKNNPAKTKLRQRKGWSQTSFPNQLNFVENWLKLYRIQSIALQVFFKKGNGIPRTDLWNHLEVIQETARQSSPTIVKHLSTLPFDPF